MCCPRAELLVAAWRSSRGSAERRQTWYVHGKHGIKRSKNMVRRGGNMVKHEDFRRFHELVEIQHRWIYGRARDLYSDRQTI